MAYLLSGSQIRRPTELSERRTTQYTEHRTLDGSVTRDYFGDEKRVWELDYQTVNQTDYTTILTIYQSYLSTGATKTWQITETNYTVAETSVHLDLIDRGFRIKGSDYLSDFTLILKEA